MKKTVSMLLSIIVAAVAICTFATSVFAQNINIPDDGRLDENTTVATTVATTAAPTTAATTAAPTTAAPTTEATTAASTTEAPTTEPTTLQDEVATRAPGETVIDEGPTTAVATKAPSTTKKPAANVSVIPSTGSSIAIPAIALLALAASTAAVIKTKKDN